MNGYNDNIHQQQIDKLQQLFPEAVTEGKIDWQKLQATLGEAVDLGERYGLGWKGKSDVFAVIQEKTVQTLHPDQANSVDWDTTGNMFIEGDNLAALKILHKAYYGKVKMIYIDRPTTLVMISFTMTTSSRRAVAMKQRWASLMMRVTLCEMTACVPILAGTNTATG